MVSLNQLVLYSVGFRYSCDSPLELRSFWTLTMKAFDSVIVIINEIDYILNLVSSVEFNGSTYRRHFDS